MNLIPISSYPMPSDDKSQMQVLRENKSELNAQAQAVEQSSMHSDEKAHALQEIQEKTDTLNREISHKQVSVSVKHDEDNRRIYKKQTESARVEKEQLGNAAKTVDLQQGENKHHKLDAYA